MSIKLLQLWRPEKCFESEIRIESSTLNQSASQESCLISTDVYTAKNARLQQPQLKDVIKLGVWDMAAVTAFFVTREHKPALLVEQGAQWPM